MTKRMKVKTTVKTYCQGISTKAHRALPTLRSAMAKLRRACLSFVKEVCVGAVDLLLGYALTWMSLQSLLSGILSASGLPVLAVNVISALLAIVATLLIRKLCIGLYRLAIVVINKLRG